MSGVAIVTMVCTLTVIWGGLIGSIIALRVLPTAEERRAAQQD